MLTVNMYLCTCIQYVYEEEREFLKPDFQVDIFEYADLHIKCMLYLENCTLRQ